MSERRIFIRHSCEVGGDYLPDREGLHYLVRVLRVKPGDRFHGFDAGSASYQLEWRSESQGFRVLERIVPSVEPPLSLALAQGVPKGPKFEQVLKQCTEVGIRAFFPLFTERTVVRLEPDEREGKRIRWAKIIQEASRQCGRNEVPELSGPLPWEEALEMLGSFDLVLMLYEGDAPSIRSVLESQKTAKRILMLVGPEGGWSPREVEDAKTKGARVVHLPTPILRTETAPLVAAAMVQYHYS
jgi:16S rRNA (uracil1498-N3)-methyltransferase